MIKLRARTLLTADLEAVSHFCTHIKYVSICYPPPVSEQHRTAKVAVVFPVYNTARYLRECLDSILAQSYKNFVVFAVDDGSTDTSSQILDEYAAKDQRIVVNHQKNGGVARARNVALDAIENDGSFFYVAYVDSDDYVASDFLRTMVKHMDNAKADYGVCASEMFDKNGFIKLDYAMPPYAVMDQDGIAEQFFRNPTPSKGKHDPTVRRWLSTRVFRLKAISGSRFDTKLRCGEDQEYFLRNLRQLKIGVQVPELLHFYRLRGSSLSHSTRATAYDLSIYESFNFDNKDFTNFAKVGLEQLLIDAWWQETRRIYQTRGTKEERQNVRRVFNRLASTPLLTPPSSKTKRRFLFFKLGDWFLRLYFGLRKNKNVEANKYTYFE